MNKAVLSLGLPLVLLGGIFSASSVQAQSAQDLKPVSLDVTNAPISKALRSLFQAAGIHNFIIETAAAGRVNASLQNIPFSVALRQVLSSASTPLMVVVEDGVYHVRLSLPDAGDASNAMHFYKIGVKHYDAGMMARMITHRDGLIDVPPNFVVTANSAAANASLKSAIVPTMPGVAPAPAALSGQDTQRSFASPMPESILPEGVKRIFALQSDNSLVIEATPKGFHDLTDLELASEGYDLVY